ncbi:hypothetical protein JCM9279_003487 [Rhodotorula babjevae]
MLASIARPTLRLAPHASSRTAAARALHSSPPRRAPGLFQGGGQSVGEDAADTSRKNAAVPMFIAAGAGIAGYVAYSQMSSRQQAHEEKKAAKHDQQSENVPAGSKAKVSMRG